MQKTQVKQSTIALFYLFSSKTYMYTRRKGGLKPPPLLDHLALRRWMPEHEPQHLELKPEPPKLKPPGAEASVSGVRELKPLEQKP